MVGLRAKIAHVWIIFARRQAIDRRSANGVSLSARKPEIGFASSPSYPKLSLDFWLSWATF